MDGKEELTMSLSPEDSLSEYGKNMEKCCSDCKTTKTPLWRGGPAGPKTLCNACGIRFRKRRSSEVRSGRGGADKKKETRVPATVTASSVTTVDNGEDGGLSASVKMGLVAWSKEVLLQHGRSPLSPASSSSSSWFSAPVKRQRSKRKLKEEEEAAVLLMSLSCGSVFA